jgi:chromosome segregation ATPase
MLKKKTQELEKFKFVLDYKIKDLKRDIAPREAHIQELSQKTKDMDNQLKMCNNINSTLGMTVDSLRQKQDQMQAMITTSRKKIRDNEIYIQGFKTAVYWTVQYIDDHTQLKNAVLHQLYPYVKDTTMKNLEIDPDIKKEYANQKSYLMSSKASLQKRLEKEEQIHRQDNLNVMNENVKLIKEINTLREEVQKKRSEIKQATNKNKKKDAEGNPDETARTDFRDAQQAQEEAWLASLRDEVLKKKQYIEEMQARLAKKHAEALELAQHFDEVMGGENN